MQMERQSRDKIEYRTSGFIDPDAFNFRKKSDVVRRGIGYFPREESLVYTEERCDTGQDVELHDFVLCAPQQVPCAPSHRHVASGLHEIGKVCEAHRGAVDDLGHHHQIVGPLSLHLSGDRHGLSNEVVLPAQRCYFLSGPASAAC